MSKKKTLQDIFDDDEFGILDSKVKASNVKTEDERLIESFNEINSFYEKTGREPESSNVTEFKLLSRLKALRKDDKKIAVLKSFDTYNLLGTDEEVKTLEDILKDDKFGILDTEETLSIFKLKNVPSSTDRTETDFVAQRKSMKKEEFLKYESRFKNIHQDLKKGKRKLFKYENADKNLKEGSYYVLNGVLLFLEEVNFDTENKTLPTGNRLRKDGRTRIVFENGTMSNMLYRSLDKALLDKDNDGKIVSHTTYEIDKELFDNANAVKEDDVETGWIYVLKSLSKDYQIATIKNLYKIGYSKVSVQDRIKNASNEATYLMSDVKIVSSYKTYNVNAQKFENLIHRFFASACLNVDIYDNSGKRVTPREWFIIPIEVIEEAIDLILNRNIVDYRYNSREQRIELK